MQECDILGEVPSTSASCLFRIRSCVTSRVDNIVLSSVNNRTAQRVAGYMDKHSHKSTQTAISCCVIAITSLQQCAGIVIITMRSVNTKSLSFAPFVTARLQYTPPPARKGKSYPLLVRHQQQKMLQKVRLQTATATTTTTSRAAWTLSSDNL